MSTIFLLSAFFLLNTGHALQAGEQAYLEDSYTMPEIDINEEYKNRFDEVKRRRRTYPVDRQGLYGRTSPYRAQNKANNRHALGTTSSRTLKELCRELVKQAAR